MTDADLDQLLRAADPAAHRTAPDPGTPPDRATVTPLRPRRPHWLPIAGTAAAVVAVVGVAVAVAGPGPGGSRSAGPGTPSPSAPAGGGAPTSAGPASPRPHTASAGADDERAHRLLGTLQDAVPDRYGLPTGPPGNPGAVPTSGPGGTLPTLGPDGTGMPASDYEAVRDEGPPGYTGYEYDAWSTVTDGARVGTVGARVWLDMPPGDLCLIESKVAYLAGTCRLVTTPNGRVALTDVDPAANEGREDDERETQWAVYRHPDGTVVLVSQGPGVLNAEIPRLRRQVWTPAQLAALATDPEFAR
jgi:hypothetical protein